ncbi:helix-hairpin-helix domain-containing protein [Corynebacterium sp. 22_2729]|uniref:ComEA family DNA-binding protein n=1 Tax=uncultured Corynebacterium sp. TaxID=159447 RepID=UPI0025ED9BD0|nr:ComEA family DNA-binding protein [uncultured Corynebacterium sp.]
MSTRRMRQSSVEKVRARAEALAQPMPEHELSNVDLDTHAVIGGRASRALIGLVVVAVLICVTLFACQRGGENGASEASGTELLAGTSGPAVGASGTSPAPVVQGVEQSEHVPGGMGDGQGSAGGAGADDKGDEQDVVVSVQGMVRRPGLLRLKSSTRVGEAIEAAGGGLPKSVVLGINLAEPVGDGMQIVVDDRGSRVVYAGGAVSAPGGAGAKGASAGNAGTAGNTGNAGGRGGTAGAEGAEGKVNLNTADSTQLETISGIGPATAEAIIAWRDSNGPFTSVEQLLEVRGIGPAKFEAMRDAVTL